MQLRQPLGRNDAGVIYFGQFPFQEADVIGRWKQAVQMSLIITSQFANHTLFDAFVQLEIWLEGGKDTVLLMLHHFVGLVDGKVECGHELAVLPRFIQVELVIELAVARQEINNDSHSADEYQCSV